MPSRPEASGPLARAITRSSGAWPGTRICGAGLGRGWGRVGGRGRETSGRRGRQRQRRPSSRATPARSQVLAPGRSAAAHPGCRQACKRTQPSPHPMRAHVVCHLGQALRACQQRGGVVSVWLRHVGCQHEALGPAIQLVNLRRGWRGAGRAGSGSISLRCSTNLVHGRRVCSACSRHRTHRASPPLPPVWPHQRQCASPRAAAPRRPAPDRSGAARQTGPRAAGWPGRPRCGTCVGGGQARPRCGQGAGICTTTGRWCQGRPEAQRREGEAPPQGREAAAAARAGRRRRPAATCLPTSTEPLSCSCWYCGRARGAGAVGRVGGQVERLLAVPAAAHQRSLGGGDHAEARAWLASAAARERPTGGRCRARGRRKGATQWSLEAPRGREGQRKYQLRAKIGDRGPF